MCVPALEDGRLAELFNPLNPGDCRLQKMVPEAPQSQRLPGGAERAGRGPGFATWCAQFLTVYRSHLTTGE